MSGIGDSDHIICSREWYCVCKEAFPLYEAKAWLNDDEFYAACMEFVKVTSEGQEAKALAKTALGIEQPTWHQIAIAAGWVKKYSPPQPKSRDFYERIRGSTCAIIKALNDQLGHGPQGLAFAAAPIDEFNEEERSSIFSRIKDRLADNKPLRKPKGRRGRSLVPLSDIPKTSRSTFENSIFQATYRHIAQVIANAGAPQPTDEPILKDETRPADDSPEAWPPDGFVSVNDIMHGEDWMKAGKHPPRSTISQWEKCKAGSPDKKIADPADKKTVAYPLAWARARWTDWTPRPSKTT